jgi:hypothetical protein
MRIDIAWNRRILKLAVESDSAIFRRVIKLILTNLLSFTFLDSKHHSSRGVIFLDVCSEVDQVANYLPQFCFSMVDSVVFFFVGDLVSLAVVLSLWLCSLLFTYT